MLFRRIQFTGTRVNRLAPDFRKAGFSDLVDGNRCYTKMIYIIVYKFLVYLSGQLCY